MIIKIKDKVDEIVTLTNAGLNNNEIAEKLGSNPPAIRYWQKKLGIKQNPVAINKLTDLQKQQALHLYQESKNALLVAEQIGSTQYLVLKFLKESNIDTSSKFFKGDLADTAINQYKAGMTQEQIAEFHGCERQAVQTLFERLGIKGRTQLEQKQITWPVRSYPSKGTDRLMPTLHICGSKEICEGFISFSEQVLGRKIKGSVKKYNDPRRTVDLFYFRFNGMDAKIVGLCMFDGANPKYTIKRKTENAMSFKDYIPKINRKK